jgi:CHAD domain-containing protein
MNQAKSTVLADTPDGRTLSTDAASEPRSINRPAGQGDHARRDSNSALLPSPDWLKARDIGLRHLDRFISLEPKVLQGDDAEAVHDMRVVSRRMQQILQVLYPAPVPKEIRRCDRRIRRARRVLSELRNYDVQIQRVNKSLARSTRARSDVWSSVKAYLEKRRAATFQEGQHRLGKLNLAALYVRLKHQLLADDARDVQMNGTGHTSANSRSRTSADFEAHLRQSLQAIWQAYETRVSESERDPSQAALHNVRIAAKRLRYIIEVMDEIEIPGSSDALVWLRKLQEHLGDWHDLEVLEQMLIEMVARRNFLRDHLELAITIEKVIQRNRITKKNYVQRYFQMVESSEGNQRIREWVAQYNSTAETELATEAS